MSPKEIPSEREKPASLSPSSTPLPPPTEPQSPHSTHQNHQSNLQTIINEAVAAANPSLRHLASHSSFHSQQSNGSHGARSRSRKRGYRRPLSTTFESQRFEGNEKTMSLTRNTKVFDPFGGIDTKGLEAENGNEENGKKHVRYGSDRTLFNEHSRIDEGDDGLDKELEIPRAGLAAGSGFIDTEGEDSSKELTDERDIGLEAEVEDDDGQIYPKPLGLFILIVGISLSVFLISLDRTIITTAVPLITSEFNSADDIGWYGSSYLLTASAFQPLYGRIFMLFNMKWSYLVSLAMFELGSLICAAAPDSVTLIVGRAIAGLGSAGILTGSFVVVSHAVPLKQRPVLTAVVGLMFGVGATAGPLLGGVFTDLVTWRWCFYINLPVGAATVVSMIFFFHPPKSHLMMGKSFFYRIMELDIFGNVILLGASVMLFLALQFTEQRVPWGSSEVIGLLNGSGCTFILFCVWQWWKADGALMPPRILGQRTVAAACAAGFFIYAAILIQTYYLPIYFQAIRNRSAIASGVDMIPYVVANAIFSLIAGIFVAKNGYFTAPAIIGMCIATVGCGMLTTIDQNTSTGTWLGYEVLTSAGFGLAIQQGFTAVQIVLPLDEVAIGTAAVVAFQSLGGAVFVSVGNTILQNTLFAAHIPGIDIDLVIEDGAASFREHLTAEQIPLLVNVYSRALQKVFMAAVPVAGLAVFACACMEWRNVRDQNRKDEEVARKLRRKREEVEGRLMEEARRDKRASLAASEKAAGRWQGKRFAVSCHI